MSEKTLIRFFKFKSGESVIGVLDRRIKDKGKTKYRIYSPMTIMQTPENSFMFAPWLFFAKEDVILVDSDDLLFNPLEVHDSFEKEYEIQVLGKKETILTPESAGEIIIPT